MSMAGGFAFGPFQLDVRTKCLLRDGKPMPLPARQYDLLHALVSRPGEVLLKEDLLKIVWPDVIVEENTLAKLVVSLRRALDPNEPNRYIDTVSRRGYRYVADVVPIAPAAPIGRAAADAPRPTAGELDAMVAPFLAFTNGRALIETLELSAVARARALFEELLPRHPGQAAVHVGLANACLLAFEASRADIAPDRRLLETALTHATEACHLKATYAEAWATRGFVLGRMGKPEEASGALQLAMSLDPDNSLHPVRLSIVTWGGERLRWARRALELMPGCPVAHWLAATVFVGRGALAEAEAHVDAGLAAVEDQPSGSFVFAATGLYWLKGLLVLSRGDEPGALDWFARELALEAGGHLYAREVCANTWYAIGAIHFWRGDKAAARVAFVEATTRVPGHVMAGVGLAMLEPDVDEESLSRGGLSFATVMGIAVYRRVTGDAAGAAEVIGAALSAAPAGNTGWILPIEPLLRVQQERAAWTSVLARLGRRAV